MTDEEDHGAPFKYVVAVVGKLHHVFLVRDETPEWWRLVATFRDAKRAQDYASIEQNFADDTVIGGDWPPRPDEELPPDLPALPPSSLIPGEIVRRSTVVEHTRIEQHEALQPTPQMRDDLDDAIDYLKHTSEERGYQRGLAAALANSPVGSPEAPPAELPAELVPAAGDGQTSRVQAVMPQGSEFADAASDGAGADEAVVALDRQDGPAPPIPPEPDATFIAYQAGLESTLRQALSGEAPLPPSDELAKSYAAPVLHSTDEAKAEPQPEYAPEFHPAETDYPVELVDAAGLRPLNRQELEVWRSLVALLGGTARVVKPSELIAKSGIPAGSMAATLFSLETKGYAKNVGKPHQPHWLITCYGAPRVSEGRWPQQKKIKPSPKSEPVKRDLPKAAQSPPKPTHPLADNSAHDDGEINIDDVSGRAKSLLVAIMAWHDGGARKWDPEKICAAANDDIGADRLPFLLGRLRELGCIQQLSAGRIGWEPTQRGRDFAEQVAAAGGHAPSAPPKPETKVSFPVVRRTPLEPAAKNNVRAPQSLPRESPAPGFRLDMASYLETKGRTVSRAGNGWFIINGERRSFSDVLMLVNEFRKLAEIPALGIDDVS